MDPINTASFKWPTADTSLRANLDAYRNARFGLFMHYGLYSLLGRGEWVRYHEDIPQNEYSRLADQFTAKDFDADAWAELARAAGMRYAVLTTKHHDGFCLWDSKVTQFTSVHSAAGRDLVAEHVAACRRAGLGVGLYLSVKDWSIPAYFRGPSADPVGWQECVRRYHQHVEELLTGYGRIDLLWFDCSDDANFTGEFSANAGDIWKSQHVKELIDRHQPWLIYNDRGGIAGGVRTPEQEIPPAWSGDHYESCITINQRYWGWCPTDPYKSTSQLLSALISTAANAGNMLLNVPPAPTGAVPEPARQRLEEVGAWMKTYGRAIYGSKKFAPWWSYTATGRLILGDRKAFLAIYDYPPNGEVVITQLANHISSATLMTDGTPLTLSRHGRRVIVANLPAAPKLQPVVIQLELDGPATHQPHYVTTA